MQGHGMAGCEAHAKLGTRRTAWGAADAFEARQGWPILPWPLRAASCKPCMRPGVHACSAPQPTEAQATRVPPIHSSKTFFHPASKLHT